MSGALAMPASLQRNYAISASTFNGPHALNRCIDDRAAAIPVRRLLPIVDMLVGPSTCRHSLMTGVGYADAVLRKSELTDTDHKTFNDWNCCGLTA